jgi:hypothetical protein
MKSSLTSEGPAPLLRAFLLAAITLYPIWFTIHYRAVYDPDIWWHMRAGEWVLQNHAVPHTDWLSTAGQGKPWVLYSWMFDALVAALYRVFGLFGPIILYPVVMAVMISVALWVLVAELGLGFWQRTLVTAASLLALAPICSPRPGLFSALFLATELALVLHSRRTNSVVPICALPLLFLVWANIHVQFVYGLFVLGLFVLEPGMEPWLHRTSGLREFQRRRIGALELVFGLSVTATLINPYFLGLYKVVVGLATQRGQYQYISELQPPTFRSLNSIIELCIIVAAWAVLALRRNFRWVPTTFLLVGTVFALRTVRDVWFGVLAAVIALAWPKRKFEVHSVHERWPVVAATALLVVTGSVLIGKTHPLRQRELWKDTADEFPVAAVEYIKNKHLSGPLFNDWNWGGFLTWALPEIPVYVDSRTNLPGDEVLERNIGVWSGAPGWAEDPALSKARLIVANPNNSLTSLLRFDPRFRVLYEDGTAVVLVKH